MHKSYTSLLFKAVGAIWFKAVGAIRFKAVGAIQFKPIGVIFISFSVAHLAFRLHIRSFVSILLARQPFIAYVWVEPHLSLASHPGP